MRLIYWLVVLSAITSKGYAQSAKDSIESPDTPNGSANTSLTPKTKDLIVQLLHSPWSLVMLLFAVLAALFLLLVYSKARIIEIDKWKVKITPVSPPQRRQLQATHQFQREMIDDLEHLHEERIKQICGLEYHERMAWENDFLIRVGALYEGAVSVYAVTLSSVSDFWVSEPDRLLIRRYLEKHKHKNIHRLFVFDSPYDLMRYGTVLANNYQSYGATGGVYVTSRHCYLETLLPMFCSLQKRDKFLQKDLGVWESEISVLAELEGTQLDFRQINEDQCDVIDVRAFKTIFDAGRDGVTKWSGSSRPENIAKDIFPPEDLPFVGSVYHLVFMNHPKESVIDEIASKIVELDEIEAEAIKKGIAISFSMGGPWWGRNLQTISGPFEFSDGKYRGKLKCDDEYQCMLLIMLPSISDLREWYEYDKHSDIRKEVYIKLMSSLAKLFKVIDDDAGAGQAKFEEIEEKLYKSHRLRRMDFVFNKKLSDIVPFALE